MLDAVQSRLGRHRSGTLAFAVSFLLACWWIATLEIERSWSWDESMHAQLPAARMLLHLQSGELESAFEVLHNSVQYPFGWPLVLAAVQSVFGLSEFACRVAGLIAWCGVIFGSFLLAVEVGRAGREDGESPAPGERIFPWLALGFTALSPLGLGYGQSLFLEIPFALCAVFTLRAWLRRTNGRGRAGDGARHLIAGLWLTTAFFVKFNYGILLIFGCGLDAIVGLVVAARRGELWAEARRLCFTVLPLVLGLLWWLVLPLPFGVEMGQHHLDSMLSFLSGNQQLVGAPPEQRVIFWLVFMSYTTRLFLLQALGVLVSLRFALQPGARLLWLVFLGAGLPVWTHSFQLDRFLLPNAPVFWVLAALGVSSVLPRALKPRSVVLGVLAAGALIFPSLDALWVGERLGLVPAEGAGRDYVRSVLREKHRLGPTRRFWTPGFAPATTHALLDLVTADIGVDERAGWIGNSTEVPPAVFHLAMYAKSGNRERFLADAHRPVDVSFTAEDPKWSDAELAAFARRFDVIITTDPPDLAGRASRAFVRGYAARLVEPMGWSVKLLGEMTIPKENGPPLPLTVYSLRPPQAAEGGSDEE